MSLVKPKTKVPSLQVATLNGNEWALENQNPELFTMIVFYRGLHCPICKKYLGELDKKIDKFEERGVNVIAVSTDPEVRARKSRSDWNIENILIGYGMSIDKAREMGLYISEKIKDEEPDLFSEPGLFLVWPDRTLYAADIQTMPFVRPGLDELLKAIDFIKENDYPPRGEA